MTRLDKVDIGGIEFLPTGTSGFVFERLVDWFTIPESKTDVRERPVADGAFDIDRDWRSSVALSLVGHYLGSDAVDAAQAAEDLTRALGAGRQLPIAVTDPLRTTTRQVSIQKVTIPDDGALDEVSFAIDMIARDPNRYGAELAPFTGLPTAGTGYVWPAVWPADWGTGGDPGRVSATNAGTATTYPVLEVRGGLGSGAELVEIMTGSYLRLERDIPSTSTVFFDTRTGGAYIDQPSNDVSGLLTRRDWGGFAVPAGATRTVQFNALGVVSGTPRLTVRYAPAY